MIRSLKRSMAIDSIKIILISIIIMNNYMWVNSCIVSYHIEVDIYLNLVVEIELILIEMRRTLHLEKRAYQNKSEEIFF